MKPIFYACLSLFFLITMSSCKTNTSEEKTNASQIQGSLVGYEAGQAKINIMGFFVAPQFDGVLNTDGNFSIDLPTNFTDVTQTSFTEYNTQSGAAYELSAIGINDVFSPLEDLEITGENTAIALAGKYYGFELYNKETKIGRLFPGSSKDFIEYNINPDKFSPLEGYFYMWLYSAGDITIKGSNNSALEADDEGKITLKSSRTYNIELKHGWNIVKYTVQSVMIDSNGNPQVLKSAFSTVNNAQNDIQWFYFSL